MFFSSLLRLWHHPLRINGAVIFVRYLSGFCVNRKKKLINDTYIRGYFRRDCKFYDFSTTVFTQTYNLLFRYVIAIPSLQRATSNLNSCNIFFQALRTSPRIAAVFMFLNMVHHDEDSERKFLSFDFDAIDALHCFA